MRLSFLIFTENAKLNTCEMLLNHQIAKLNNCKMQFFSNRKIQQPQNFLYLFKISSVMALRRHVFSSKKGIRKYLKTCASMYMLNGNLPSSAKTCILLDIFFQRSYFDKESFVKSSVINTVCLHIESVCILSHVCILNPLSAY